MKIEITNPVIQKKTITGKNGNFDLYQIEAWATLSNDGYPEKVVLSVESTDTFEVGMYDLKPESFYVGSFNSLALGKAKLVKQK